MWDRSVTIVQSILNGEENYNKSTTFKLQQTACESNCFNVRMNVNYSS